MEASKEKICASCSGTGKCFKCEGTGHIVVNLPSPMPVISGKVRGTSETGTRRTCPKCFGSGICQICKGTRIMP